MRHHFRIAIWSFLCVATAVAGATESAAPKAVGYLTEAEKVALLESVPPPPETGSNQDKADLAAVLKAQNERTPEQLAAIKNEAEFKIELMFTATTIQLSAADFPATSSVLKKMDADVTDVYHRAKSKFKRLRPFRAHPEVKNIVDANGFGYPSGHTTRSFALAGVLSELFCDKQDALSARATQIAQDRMSGGEHYPSDLESGKALGRAIYTAVSAKKEFLADLEAAKIELKKAGTR